MSIETSPYVSQYEQTKAQFEGVGEADGVPYVIDEMPKGGTRALIEYSDLIERIKGSLESFGYDSSRNFDITIVAWLRHHCGILPTDSIALISKEEDWGGWYDKTAPWFAKFESVQREHDTIQGRMPFMPLKRPEIELYLEDTLLWHGIKTPHNQD